MSSRPRRSAPPRSGATCTPAWGAGRRRGARVHAPDLWSPATLLIVNQVGLLSPRRRRVSHRLSAKCPSLVSGARLQIPARRPTPAPNRGTSVPENLARCALIGGMVSSREEAFMSHFVGLFLLCLAVTLAVLGNGHKP